MMELPGTRYCVVLLALAPLAVSSAETASAAGRHHHASRPLYLYAPAAVTVSAPTPKPSSGWQPYAVNTDFSQPTPVPDQVGPLSKAEETSSQRAAAILECNNRSRRIGAERDWQAATYTLYGVCMIEKGQRFS
jgi:hypothetical protein